MTAPLCECGCGGTTRPMPYPSQARRFINGHRVLKWTAADRDFLTAHYADMKSSELAAALGKSEQAVKSYAMKILGLAKGGRQRTLRGWFEFYTPIRPENGCWEWQGSRTVPQGYGTINAGRSFWFAHRLSLYLHNGRLPRSLDVLHHCDNKACVNPAHLYLGTDSDNQRDIASRTWRRGQRFTPEGVIALRERFQRGGVTKAALAREFGVNHMTIHAIVTGKSWGWLSQPDAAYQLRQGGEE